MDELCHEGQNAVEEGLAEFAHRYSKLALKRVISSRGADYESVPEG
jgi:hypothetical protein